MKKKTSTAAAGLAPGPCHRGVSLKEPLTLWNQAPGMSSLGTLAHSASASGPTIQAQPYLSSAAFNDVSVICLRMSRPPQDYSSVSTSKDRHLPQCARVYR